MARFGRSPEGLVPFTAEEEAEADAREQAWADGTVARNAFYEIQRLESTVTPRRIREMTTVAGAKWVDDVEKLIAIERSKL